MFQFGYTVVENELRSYTLRKTILFSLLFTFLIASLASQTPQLATGLEEFRSGKYDKALLDFREIILDKNLETIHGDAYFWIAQSYLALGQLDDAEKNVDFFMMNYPNHRSYPEAVYQKGRILFLQKEYDQSIQVLYRFLEDFPDNPFRANSYFWIADSLYSLGHFEDARVIFSIVVDNYPSSYRVEAARYRIALLDQKNRELELQKLLKLSNEEYLFALEEFQRRERTYEQAILSYQRKLASFSALSSNEQMQSLAEEIAAKDQQIMELQSQVSLLRNQVNQLISQLSDSGTETLLLDSETGELLDMKTRALKLEQFYLDWLEENMEED